ncbi:unnamed protein product [Cuscuta europaea]|uniref:Pectinesterase inhibitor domain-containing protein n=1 Tax=Cuscuta europaea TaxID=41803 RepID=A0A9P0Z3R5_CUSEU|nr:unnamed protein product [Cuscuta europaea]
MAPLMMIRVLLLLSLLFCCDRSAAQPPPPSSSAPIIPSCNVNFINASCYNATTHKPLCVESLTPYADYIGGSKRRIALVALCLSRAKARDAASFVVAKLKEPKRNLTRMEFGAMRDCQEEMKGLDEELRPSITELGQAKTGSPDAFAGHMGNVQTWVSAALTDIDTCFEGLPRGSELRGEVEGAVSCVYDLISNALALINDFAASRTHANSCKKPHHLLTQLPHP